MDFFYLEYFRKWFYNKSKDSLEWLYKFVAESAREIWLKAYDLLHLRAPFKPGFYFERELYKKISIVETHKYEFKQRAKFLGNTSIVNTNFRDPFYTRQAIEIVFSISQMGSGDTGIIYQKGNEFIISIIEVTGSKKLQTTIGSALRTFTLNTAKFFQHFVIQMRKTAEDTYDVYYFLNGEEIASDTSVTLTQYEYTSVVFGYATNLLLYRVSIFNRLFTNDEIYYRSHGIFEESDPYERARWTFVKVVDGKVYDEIFQREGIITDITIEYPTEATKTEFILESAFRVSNTGDIYKLEYIQKELTAENPTKYYFGTDFTIYNGYLIALNDALFGDYWASYIEYSRDYLYRTWGQFIGLKYERDSELYLKKIQGVLYSLFSPPSVLNFARLTNILGGAPFLEGKKGKVINIAEDVNHVPYSITIEYEDGETVTYNDTERFGFYPDLLQVGATTEPYMPLFYTVVVLDWVKDYYWTRALSQESVKKFLVDENIPRDIWEKYLRYNLYIIGYTMSEEFPLFNDKDYIESFLKRINPLGTHFVYTAWHVLEEYIDISISPEILFLDMYLDLTPRLGYNYNILTQLETNKVDDISDELAPNLDGEIEVLKNNSSIYKDDIGIVDISFE